MNRNMEILLDFFPLNALFNTVSSARPLDSTLSEDDGIEPRYLLRLWHWQSDAPTLSARSHPQTDRSHRKTARSHPQTVRSHPQTVRSHPQTARSHPQTARSHPQTARQLINKC
jgi:hypothetical protein